MNRESGSYTPFHQANNFLITCWRGYSQLISNRSPTPHAVVGHESGFQRNKYSRGLHQAIYTGSMMEASFPVRPCSFEYFMIISHDRNHGNKLMWGEIISN